MKYFRAALCLLSACAWTAAAEDLPKGLEPVFKKIEPGKRFHAFWPPVSGQSILGTIVIADKPDRPQAFFRTIDSPTYRNPEYKDEFIVGQISYAVPDLTEQRNVGVDVAFAQLDAIGKAILTGPTAGALSGSSGKSDKSGGAGGNGSSSEGQSTKPGSSRAAKEANSGNAQSSAGSASPAADQNRTVTGADFKRFTNASVKLTGIKVIFYDLPTLMDVQEKHALKPTAEQILTRERKGWFIHRALVVDSIEYTLVSNRSFDAGFFDKLLAWIPTVAVKLKTDRTITLKTTSALTIGYKLWQRGTGIAGESIGTDLDKTELGAGDIDSQVLLTKTP